MFEDDIEFTVRTVKSKVPEVDGYAVDKAFKGKGGGESMAVAQGFQQIMAQQRQEQEKRKLNKQIRHRANAVKRKSMGRSSLLSGSESGETKEVSSKVIDEAKNKKKIG